MDMAVHYCLPCCLSAVHTYIEAIDSFICGENVLSHLIKKHVDRTPLRVVKVKICDRMAALS
jgi:hypothetical protein